MLDAPDAPSLLSSNEAASASPVAWGSKATLPQLVGRDTGSSSHAALACQSWGAMGSVMLDALKVGDHVKNFILNATR